MRKKDLKWICLPALLMTAAAVLIFLPRNVKDPDDKTVLTISGGEENALVLSEQDSGDILSASVLGKRVQTSDKEKTEIEAEMAEIGKLCRVYYLQTEKIPSEYFGQEKIGQTDIDAMEDILRSAGYCVENSDEAYPAYLENTENLTRFWNDVTKENDAKTAVWSISPDGSVHGRVFQYADGKGYCVYASCEWDDAGFLHLVYLEKKEILFWNMTETGFIYQDIYFDRHWNAANRLRLQPVDRGLYEWTEKYIAPVGYYNVNLFLLDWDSSDFGNVCFNDLFAGMYRLEYGDYFYAQNYPHSDVPFSHSMIPADLFETVVFEHFDISPEEFRKRALYDAENDAYPWQDLDCGNILYYPEVIPEVTQVTENDDGTVTLLVNVLCPDKHTDHLFEHEVTMRINPDGSFQYLSNRIVYRSENELPSPQARIEVQRFPIED